MAGMAAVAVLLVGCASQPNSLLEDEAASNADDQWAQTDETGDVNDTQGGDPAETLNRFIFAFNDAVDTVIFRPLAEGYRFIVPEPIRDVVRNFIRNTKTPVILANDLLQGDLDRAEDTFARFLINTTAGAGGLVDIAEYAGHPYHEEDFGQTLGSWGVGEGPYIVLPILGPSNARDTVGLVADTLMDPLTYLAESETLIARRAADGLDWRSRNIETIDELKRDSIDFYARVRSLYHQQRVNEIRNQEANPGEPDFSEIFPEDDQVSDLGQ